MLPERLLLRQRARALCVCVVLAGLCPRMTRRSSLPYQGISLCVWTGGREGTSRAFPQKDARREESRRSHHCPVARTRRGAAASLTPVSVACCGCEQNTVPSEQLRFLPPCPRSPSAAAFAQPRGAQPGKGAGLCRPQQPARCFGHHWAAVLQLGVCGEQQQALCRLKESRSQQGGCRDRLSCVLAKEQGPCHGARCPLPCYQARKHALKTGNVTGLAQKPPSESVCPKICFLWPGTRATKWGALRPTAVGDALQVLSSRGCLARAAGTPAGSEEGRDEPPLQQRDSAPPSSQHPFSASSLAQAAGPAAAEQHSATAVRGLEGKLPSPSPEPLWLCGQGRYSP